MCKTIFESNLRCLRRSFAKAGLKFRSSRDIETEVMTFGPGQASPISKTILEILNELQTANKALPDPLTFDIAEGTVPANRLWLIQGFIGVPPS